MVIGYLLYKKRASAQTSTVQLSVEMRSTMERIAEERLRKILLDRKSDTLPPRHHMVDINLGVLRRPSRLSRFQFSTASEVVVAGPRSNMLTESALSAVDDVDDDSFDDVSVHDYANMSVDEEDERRIEFPDSILNRPND